MIEKPQELRPHIQEVKYLLLSRLWLPARKAQGLHLKAENEGLICKLVQRQFEECFWRTGAFLFIPKGYGLHLALLP